MLISAPGHQPIRRRSSSAKRGRGTSRRLVEGAPLAQNLPPSSPPKAGAHPEMMPRPSAGGRNLGMGPGFRREGAWDRAGTRRWFSPARPPTGPLSPFGREARLALPMAKPSRSREGPAPQPHPHPLSAATNSLRSQVSRLSLRERGVERAVTLDADQRAGSPAYQSVLLLREAGEGDQPQAGGGGAACPEPFPILTGESRCPS